MAGPGWRSCDRYWPIMFSNSRGAVVGLLGLIVFYILIISVKNNLEKVRSEIPGKIDDVIIEIQQSGPIKAF